MTTHVSTYCTSNNYNMVYTFLQLLHSLYYNNKYIDFYKAHKMPINLKKRGTKIPNLWVEPRMVDISFLFYVWE